VALIEAAKTQPTIAETIRRVQQRRVEFLAGIYEQLDMPPDDARQLAVLALLAQVGMAVVAETAPALVPTGEQPDTLRSLLTPPG
jgi:predicted transcriptional regulator